MRQFAFFYVQAPVQKFVEKRILRKLLSNLDRSVITYINDLRLLVLDRSYILDGSHLSRLQEHLRTKKAGQLREGKLISR